MIRVLVVEDEPIAARAHKAYVERVAGFTVVAVANSRIEAERALSKGGIDLVMLDLHLPDIKGIDVLKALRGDPRTSGIPVAVLSADATRAQVGRLLDAGAQRYFTKPIDVTEVYAFLDSHAR